MLLIVVIKTLFQIAHDCLGVRPMGQASVVALEGFHKTLCHAVALWSFHGVGAKAAVRKFY